VTGKASAVDPYGNPTAFHLRLRDQKDKLGASKPPRGGLGEFAVGFGDTEVSSSQRETEAPKPPDKAKMNIKDDSIGVVLEAREGLAGLDPDEVEAIGGKSLVFEVGEQELPFTNQNFLLSFSLPSFYFHATTSYDILRMLGVPLTKGDFLGATRIGA